MSFLVFRAGFGSDCFSSFPSLCILLLLQEVLIIVVWSTGLGVFEMSKDIKIWHKVIRTEINGSESESE